MKQPTQEQIKEFWEWCGLQYEPDQDCFRVIFPDGEWYNFGSDWKMGKIEPPIDLDSLFKYAVPKMAGWCMRNYKKGTMAVVWPTKFHEDDWLDKPIFTGEHKDPALALFWALDKVRKEKSK